MVAKASAWLLFSLAGVILFASRAAQPPLFRGAEVKTVDGLRGVFASSDLSAGHVVLEEIRNSTIDGAMCLSNASSMLRSLSSDNVERLQKAQTLDVLCLLELRKEPSMVATSSAFLMGLPQNPDLPLLWSKKQQLWDPLKRMVSTTKADVKQLYEQSSQAFVGFKDRFRLRDLVWAYAIFLSRAVKTSWSPRAVLPNIAMFNHARDAMADTKFGSDGQSLQVVLRRPASKGSHLTLNYGLEEQVATQTMYQFGFVDEAAPPSVLLEVATPGREVHPLKITSKPYLKLLVSDLRSSGLVSSSPEALYLLRSSSEAQLHRMPSRPTKRMWQLASMEREALENLLRIIDDSFEIGEL